jgi:hypothetical protein
MANTSLCKSDEGYVNLVPGPMNSPSLLKSTIDFLIFRSFASHETF